VTLQRPRPSLALTCPQIGSSNSFLTRIVSISPLTGCLSYADQVEFISVHKSQDEGLDVLPRTNKSSAAMQLLWVGADRTGRPREQDSRAARAHIMRRICKERDDRRNRTQITSKQTTPSISRDLSQVFSSDSTQSATSRRLDAACRGFDWASHIGGPTTALQLNPTLGGGLYKVNMDHIRYCEY
jgi:hypothetical protein